MARITWDNRPYEYGVDRGVLYLPEGPGIAWDGLISVEESPGGDSGEPFHADGVMYYHSRPVNDVSLRVEAFTYPDEFLEYSGIIDLSDGQPRKTFDFSYRTQSEGSYRIHLVYNVTSSPMELPAQTQSQNPSPSNFQWEFSGRPELVNGAKPSAQLILDTAWDNPIIADLEGILYGDELVNASLPTPNEIIALFQASPLLLITDHGDGTWTADGPDEAIEMMTSTEFAISWPSAIYVNSVTYTISSM